MSGKVTQELLNRYLRVTQINRNVGGWIKQTRYDRPFRAYPRALADADIVGMLHGRYWLSSRAPSSGLTDRISFDLDADHEEQLPDLFGRYSALRHLFGEDRLPLVYRTPSGFGVRVVYRIPETPLAGLATGYEGIVPDVLRGAGLHVRPSEIEVFPQAKQADRLPLGMRMPLLDPTDLTVLDDAAIGEEFDLDLLVQALEHVERWYNRPDRTLVPYLESLPRVGRGKALVVPGTPAQASRPPETVTHMVRHGLPRSGTRYLFEWQVGLALLRWPNDFADYGITASADDEAVALALSRWLSRHHNNKSEEWAQHARRFQSTETAVRAWSRRYTRGGEESTVVRLRRTVDAAAPEWRRVYEVSDEQAETILEWAEQQFEPGSTRYGYEIWTWSAFRWLKKRCIEEQRQGKFRPRDMHHDNLFSIEYRIPAKTLEKWPYGSGRSGHGQPRYLTFLEANARVGFMVRSSPYYNPRFLSPNAPEGTGEATGYSFWVPELSTRVMDIECSPEFVNDARDHLPKHLGRQLSSAEVYHALYVTRTRQPLVARYGRSVAARLKMIAATVRERMK